MAERALDIKPFLFGAIVGAGLVALEKRFPQIRLKTHPDLPLELKVVDQSAEFAAMRFIGILAHHWHWDDIEYTSEFDKFGVLLDPAPIGNLHTNRFSGVRAHLWGRPYGYIVDIDRSNEKFMNEPYFIGFRHRDSDKIRRCKLELTKPVMFLMAPDDGCIVYAMDKENRPLKVVQLSELIHRNDKPADIRIL